MTDTAEIRRMITTAMVGDGDQILNIIEKICDKLDEMDRRIRSANRTANDALCQGGGKTICE